MTLDEVPQKAVVGDPIAQEAYGWMFYEGRNVVKSYVEALYWYHKAADQGNVEAQYNLALMYARGLGTAKDMKEICPKCNKKTGIVYALAVSTSG